MLHWSPSTEEPFLVQIIPVEMMIQMGEESYQPKNSSVMLILAPDEQVDLQIDYNADQTAQCTFEKGSQLNRSVNSEQLRCDKEYVELTALFKETLQPDFDSEQFGARQRKVMNAVQQRYVDYIEQNPDSEVSIWLAFQINLRVADKYLPELEQTAQQSILSPIYQQMRERTDLAARSKALSDQYKGTTDVGQTAPDFTLKDTEGNDFALSSLRGKWVIIDFWGSWCGWCIKGIPALKEFYAANRERVEVLGVACNDTEEKWRKAIADNALEWKNVINGSTPEQSVSIRYDVNAYPTKIVVSPDGTIVMRCVGEDDEFFTKLDAVINK